MGVAMTGCGAGLTRTGAGLRTGTADAARAGAARWTGGDFGAVRTGATVAVRAAGAGAAGAAAAGASTVICSTAGALRCAGRAAVAVAPVGV